MYLFVKKITSHLYTFFCLDTVFSRYSEVAYLIISLTKNCKNKALRTKGLWVAYFVLNRYRWRLETCQQAKTSKSGHAIFFSFFRRVRATSMTQRRVEKNRVHFWTFSPVSVTKNISKYRNESLKLGLQLRSSGLSNCWRWISEQFMALFGKFKIVEKQNSGWQTAVFSWNMWGSDHRWKLGTHR